jgi:hypothetical protein
MAGRPLGSEDRRGQVVTVRLSLREKALFEKLVASGGMTIAAWLREAGLEKARQETGAAPEESRRRTKSAGRLPVLATAESSRCTDGGEVLGSAL